MSNITNHIPALNYHTMQHFGLHETGMFDSPKAQSVRKELEYNIEQGKITMLIGRYESGKTMLVRQIKRNLNKKVNFVNLDTFDDKKIPMGTILSAIVEDLGTESVRRDMRARSKQAVRLLGNKLVSEGKPTCVIIDNTPDRLHLNTLNAIKLLMEVDYNGYAPLVSFIVLAWPEFADRISSRADITHRTQIIKLNNQNGWFTYPDRVKYLEEVFADAITPDTRERIARLHEYPGDMNAYVVKMMNKAYRAGYDVLDEQIVQPSLKERYDSMKEQFHNEFSYSSIAKIAGLGKSTVALAIESEPDTASTRKVRAAMDELERDLMHTPTTTKQAV